MDDPGHPCEWIVGGNPDRCKLVFNDVAADLNFISVDGIVIL
jgi:hypothetical protein